MTESRGEYATVTNLRDADPGNDAVEGVAISFALGLAVARVLGGLVEVLLPRVFLGVLARRDAATPGAIAGFRMKGGRDLAIGLLTLGAAASGDRSAVAQFTATGVIIDAVDGVAVSRDTDTFRRALHPLGSWLGYAVAAGAAVAAWILGRPQD